MSITRLTKMKRGKTMRGGYESLTWLNDKDGKEYVCEIENAEKKSFEQLTDEEKKHCSDVNQIVGTERW